MKAILLFIVFFSVTTLSFGSGEPGIAVRKQAEPGMYTLIYKAKKKSDLTMVISDHLGVLMFKEVIPNSDGFIRPLNFKFVLSGEYSIDVIDLEGGKQSQKIDHQMPIPKLELVVL